MASYTIIRKCGHQEDIQIYGTNAHGEREHRARRESHHLCDTCRMAEGLAKAEVSDLPALIGSEREIAWAATLRDKLLQKLDTELEAEARKYKLTSGQADQFAALWREIALSQTSASWWIDARHAGAFGAVRRIIRDDPALKARFQAIAGQ